MLMWFTDLHTLGSSVQFYLVKFLSDLVFVPHISENGLLYDMLY